MKGGIWTALGAITGVLNNFVIIIIAATLLDPKDVGYLSIFLFCSGLLSVLLPLGSNYRYVREDKVGLSDYLIGVSISTALAISAALCIAISISHFNIDPLIYIAISAGSIHGYLEAQVTVSSSILQRSLKYRTIEQANIIRNVISLLLAAIGIYFINDIQAAYIAKIFGSSLFLTMIVPGIITKMERGRYLPKPYDKLSIHMTTTNVVGYLSGNSEAMFALPQLGVEKYGIYNFGRRVVSQPRDLIGSVIFKTLFPVFAKISRSKSLPNKARLIRKIYKKSLFYIAGWGLPLIALIVIMADPLITITLSEEWHDASSIVVVFSIAAIIHIFGSHLITALLTAFGESRIIFHVEIILLPIRLALVYVSSFYGALYVAIAMNSVLLLKIIILNIKSAQLMGVNFKDTYAAVLRPSLITAASSALAVIPFSYSYSVSTILLSFGVFSASYIFLSSLTNKEVFGKLRPHGKRGK